MSLCSVPTMFIELEHPPVGEFDTSSLRTDIIAGSPCPVEAMKKVQSQPGMTEVTICYGMTATLPLSTRSALDDPLDKGVSTVGRVHADVEIKIVDPPTGIVVPRGTLEELCTRGYLVMPGADDHALDPITVTCKIQKFRSCKLSIAALGLGQGARVQTG